jgi:hypothetical protein
MSCNVLDTREDIMYTDEMIASNYNTIKGFGYTAYSYVRNGFQSIDGNLFAPVSDEAEQTASTSQSQLFNTASWNAFNNPDDVYENDYEGIRAANYFLENYKNYKTLLAVNRDTLTDNGHQYRLDIADVGWLYQENRVLRAYFYFDLLKRYGGVPLVTQTFSIDDNTNVPRSNFDSIVNFIVSEVDAVKDSLQTNWKLYDQNRDGRLTKAAALTLKARTLLYAASPLHNPTNDITKWEKAAEAAYAVIALNQFSLHSSYRDLFLKDNTAISNETIWAIRLGPDNQMERKNYPISTPGGNSGVTPSHNLVSAYEYKGTPDPQNPYANRDPRLAYSVVTHGSSWNNRTIDIRPGGSDQATNPNASRTGYYLKKFLNDGLNLVQGETQLRSWIMMRYAEVLLDYAEAMNEAFGPDDAHGWGLSARDAVNAVRNRPGVQMPSVIANNQAEMRNRIKHERQIELAFEDHRYWDLLRWKDAESLLNQPLKGIRVTKNNGGNYTYTEFVVERRSFVAPKMYCYPLPQIEISKSNGILSQNAGW